MAHLHLIEDKNNQVIDQKVYCSDYCNKIDNADNYKGWLGCQEIEISQKCELKDCNNIIKSVVV
jgi:hypothetical protein|tara:strand:- start:365 stop:556 length:192 start_codon:yes stop_codon:yes gene_type:complete